MLEYTPRFSIPEVAAAVESLYGAQGDIRQLPSERDQNFLVTRPAATPFILKIANGAEDAAMLGAQHDVLTHLATRIDVTPTVLAAGDGSWQQHMTGADGRTHLVWRVSVLPGRPMAEQQRRTSRLLRELGRRTAQLTTALASFDHPAIHREFVWDLAAADRTVAERRHLLDRDPIGPAIDASVDAFLRCKAVFDSLPRAAIHGDLNDHNVLVGGGDDLYSRNQDVTGIVDFGDMVWSVSVGDLAIAAAYVALGARDPLPAIADVVAGYHEARPLNEEEIAVLFDLVRIRLTVSACMAAGQQQARPDDEYLSVSQAAIRRTLPALAVITSQRATAHLRWACGQEPAPARHHVVQFLSSQLGSLAPVITLDEPASFHALDLSVSSALLSGHASHNEEARLTPRVFAEMAAHGARVGVGAYDEPRLLYTTPAFATSSHPAAEHRTVHLGLDLFVPAGVLVHAPLDGVIRALHDNATMLDYGPVIILEHRTADDAPFFSLYGHLARTSLDGKQIGDRIERGAAFATVGASDENVGWTPHLHIQLIIDLLGLGTDFPGVARASERDLWRRLCPDANLLVGVPASRLLSRPPDPAATLAERGRRLGRNLSVAYREPVKAVRGWMQFIFDQDGHRLLDAYNNVPHVGHSHPRVADAIATQARVLATNTRYLSDLQQEYAARLSATLPSSLSVCFFVNSASEANELALRLARAHTGRKDIVVLDAAYHGNTTTLIDISPYKHAGPGGSGRPPWVHVAELPDDYRGRFRRDDPSCGVRYAAGVASLIDTLVAEGSAPGAFIAETCPSVGGQLILPPGYLRDVYSAMREANGVVIADEVQTGLGRIGSHCWAFQAHGVVPDIVVMGKPLGNGFPLAAVVTTPAIAASFDNGMEYFSTFGGNQVACAAGIAVLDVLRDEGLQDHAARTGRMLLDAMDSWVGRFPSVGDVRGAGLFLGVELVKDPASRAPAATEASYVVNRLREEGILAGTDGPFHNVIKIRPPMAFDESDALRLVGTLEGILRDELS
jgi:4-aminobutyrate aminotransferase-like enzyme/Ser/Thr protein kinase RdoA (MazF antagonist)